MCTDIRRPQRNARYSGGFTLVELLVVMVVIGILASIAIPSYRQHVMKVKRADAQTLMSSLAQSLERCYTRNNNYSDQGAANPECIFAASRDTLDATYTVTLVRSAEGAIPDQHFTITATPIGAQVNDTRCGTFTLDDAGVQHASGTDGDVKCW